jgi:hypothetical protein
MLDILIAMDVVGERSEVKMHWELILACHAQANDWLMLQKCLSYSYLVKNVDGTPCRSLLKILILWVIAIVKQRCCYIVCCGRYMINILYKVIFSNHCELL